MKKIIKNILLGIIVVAFCITVFVGCVAKGDDSVLDRLDKLEKDMADVKGRLEKLEATVASLEELATLAENYPQLGNKIEELSTSTQKLQNDLIANTVADKALKEQVTAMQAKLDKFYYEGKEAIDLSKTQAMLDKVYGQVIQDEYKMGDTIEVKYNGIHYYTIQMVGEYHDGRVIKEEIDDKMICKTPVGPKHWCGYLIFTNYIFNEVRWDTLEWELVSASRWGGGKKSIETYGTRPETIGGSYLPIKYGETKKVIWQMTYGFVEGEAFDMNFGLARGYAGEQNKKFIFVAARIKNFYDGVQQPIVATP